jgi:hypothetical protein
MTRRRPIATLLLAAAGCNPDLGRPVEMVIVQDAGVDAPAEASAPALAGPGADCRSAADCASNACFVGGKASYCSFPCTAVNQATACGAPPFNGVCNMQGFCRRP